MYSVVVNSAPPHRLRMRLPLGRYLLVKIISIRFLMIMVVIRDFDDRIRWYSLMELGTLQDRHPSRDGGGSHNDDDVIQ